MAQRPEPVGGFAGGAIGHAGFPQMPVGGAETPLDFRRRQRGEGIEETGPDRTRRAVGRDKFIGNSRQANIVARPLRHAPIGRDGPCSLTAYPDCFPGRRAPPSRTLLPNSLFSMQERRPQVEGQGKFNCAFLARRIDLAGGMAMILKPGQPPRLGLVGIDRFALVAASAGMGDVIDAAAERAAVPGIDQIKRQRRVNRNRRVQPRGRLPGLEADGRDRLARTAGLPSSASAGRCR